MGAELNAGTGKETTSVYARVIDEHVAEAFDVMADMVFRPALKDIDSERAVILEEIAMYEDDPQEKVFDLLGEAVFGDHPLGRAIIGRASVIADTPPDEIARFHAEPLRPEQRRDRGGRRGRPRRVRRARRARRSRSGPDGTAPHGRRPRRRRARPRRRFERKDTEQYHVCLGGPGLARHDERRFALRVLDNVFGGTSSSRLFQEVRERRGLAYAVYSFTSAYQDTGQVGLYIGTRPDNVAEGLAVVGAELDAPARGARHARGARARQGEPQGPRRAGARVDRRAHEPARARRSSPACRCCRSTRPSSGSTR